MVVALVALARPLLAVLVAVMAMVAVVHRSKYIGWW